MSTRRLLPFLACLAVAPGIAACGDDDDSSANTTTPVVQGEGNTNTPKPDPGPKGEAVTPAALARAASATTDVGGVRMALDQKMSFGGQTIPATATGVFDTKKRIGEMKLKMDLSGIPGAGAAGGSTEQTMVFDGLTFYMRSPMLAQAIPGGKEWIKLDLQKAGKSMGIDIGALTNGAGQDPTQALQYLKAASGDITEVGKETVRGTETTHYKGTIDFKKVPDAVPADQRAAVRQSIDQIIKLGGSSTAPMEVWIGKDGLVRKMKQQIGSQIQGQSTKVEQTIEMYDFGTKVDVKIPSDSEVTDIAELGAGLAGALKMN